MAKKTDKTSGQTSGKTSSKLRWILGWIGVPGLLIAGLLLAGVHVGARHPQMGLTRAVLWVMSAEPQLGPANVAERQPLARRLRLIALPSMRFALQSELSKDELDALVAAGAGPNIAELDCAAICEIRWQAKHPDREFISAHSCELTQPTLFSTAKIECDAKVQR